MPESWWDDFSNNLATDLAPLIALLGESPTKQYLSECITWEDTVIFAAAPLGIITAVVSAIRVYGTPSLRAFIGKAQEGAGVAEAELCSSTSRDVCELYSNGGIARVFGRPKLLEIIHNPLEPFEEFFPNSVITKGKAGIYSFQDYVTRGSKKQDWQLCSSDAKKRSSGKYGPDEQRNARFAPNPNLSLNIGIIPRSHFWFIAAAAWGLSLQLAVLVWAALARYYLQWTRDSNEDEYAVPMTVIGTILLCFGMGLCAHLVERKTDERTYERRVTPEHSGKPTRMYWVQPGNQSIGDQTFDAFAYSDERFPLQRYITSWKKTEEESYNMAWIWTAVVTTSVGFVCQFLGLRACHSSVAVAQFGATIFMSLVRASLRTQRLSVDDNLLKNNRDYVQGNELDFLALNMAQSLTRMPSESEKNQLGPVWVVVNISPPSECDITAAVHPGTADAASGPSTGESSRFRVLERLSMVSSGLPNLCGFRIHSKVRDGEPRTEEYLLHEVNQDLFIWKLSEYCIEHESRCNRASRAYNDCCKLDFNAAVTSMFYRGRLAHLTGLEQPKSEHSSYWGKHFVPVRETAIMLALAIEDTMQILFDLHSTEPANLCRPWQQAVVIFWTLRSFFHDRSRRDCYGDIHMSLRRTTDGIGAPKGPWKADRSEIEAVLGLWAWSLRSQSADEENLPWMIKTFTSRILSSHKDMERASEERVDVDIWREVKDGSDIRQEWLNVQVSDIDATQHGGGFITKKRTNRQAQKPIMRCIQSQNATWCGFPSSKDGFQANVHINRFESPPWKRQYFGWCNVVAEEVPHATRLAVLEINRKDSVLLNCAQEIYSTFLTAILNIVDDIGKSYAVTPRQTSLAGTASNGIIKRIQQSLIARGLCDEEAAFACTIPILKRHGKLKLPDEILEMAGELADKYQSEQKWKELRELLNWMHHQLLPDFDGKRRNRHPAEKLNATNGLRLSVLQLCVTYNDALLQDDDEVSEFGLERVLEMVEEQSKEDTYKNMPLVWRDCGPLTDSSSSQPSNVADTIRCYGKAALWHLCCKDSLNTRQQQFRERFERHFPPHQSNISGSLAQAMEKLDLSATLILLQRQPPNRWERTQVLIRASRNGWLTVIKALSAGDVAVNKADQDGRTALSYASELGDINAVRVLIKVGATENVYDDFKKRMLPSHYAAKGGNAVVITDILAKWPDSCEEEDEKGMLPLNWAITSGNIDAVRAFEKKGNGNWHMYNSYHNRRPPLHWAIKERNAGIVGALLESGGVDPNLSSTSSIKTPPLTCAVRLRDESIFDRILRSKRVDADTSDPDGRSTIWWAAALGLHSYVRKLLESVQMHHPERPDNSGETPLSIAAQRGYHEVVGELMKTRAGARAGAAASLETVLMAARNGHVAVVKVLLPHKVSSKEQARLILEYFRLQEILHEVHNSEFGVQPQGTSLKNEEIVEALEDMDLSPKEMKRWHDFEKELDSFTLLAD